MNVLVFGAGALGSVVGGQLAAHHAVLLVARPDHTRAINASGLRIEGVRATQVRLAALSNLSGTEQPDLALVTTKSFDTVAAASALRKVMQPAAVVCSIQNGIGNYEALRAAFPKSRVLACSATIGALFVGPGHVRYTGLGQFVFGGTSPDLQAANGVAREFRLAGFEAEAAADIQGHLWLKAIVNAAINPLGASEGVPNGELVRRPALLERMRRVVGECEEIVRAQGIQLPNSDPFSLVVRVAEQTAQNRSSMLQSLDRNRRTEIEAITGAFLGAARRFGLPAPENAALYEAILQKERALAVR